MFDVITIGSATRDAFFEGLEFDYHRDDAHANTPESICLPLGSKVKVKKVTFTTGGAGTNAPVTFARQGFATAAIIRTGNDVSGETIKRELQGEGVDTSFIQVDVSASTDYSVILMAKKAERTILSFKEASAKLDVNQIPWEALETKWIYLDSLSGNGALLENVFALKKEKKISVIWNPGTDDIKKGLTFFQPYFDMIDVFSANQEELAELFNLPFESEKEILKTLYRTVKGISIMTKGSKGVLVSDGNIVYQAGAFPENVLVDRTGAGDAFCSGFLVGYLREGIEEGMRVGSANSTSVLERIGSKEGILRQKDLENPRWAHLEVTSYTL